VRGDNLERAAPSPCTTPTRKEEAEDNIAEEIHAIVKAGG
jgi:hypothetical protein